jgi:hypothetical protein
VHVVHGAEARFKIASFKLVDSTDRDGDGFFRGYKAVLDVDANTNFDTLTASWSYQVQGNPRWFPLIPSRRLVVKGATLADTMGLELEGGAHRTLGLKAVITSPGGTAVDSAEIAPVREEIAGQDSAGLRWVFLNRTGAILHLDAEVGSRTLGNHLVPPDDSVVVDLASKSAFEKLSYRAVSAKPGDSVEWKDEQAMEMDRFEVPAIAVPSEEHFALFIRNGSSHEVTAIILNPNTPAAKTYAAAIPPRDEERNMGLFAYAAGTTVAFRLSSGATRTYNSVDFHIHQDLRYRYAKFILD